MAEVSKEEWMKLAIKAFNQGQFQSKTSCAQAFDVPSQTLKCLKGVTSHKEYIANGWKLSNIEEMTQSRWILDMYHCGLPLQISNVHYLAQLLLSAVLHKWNPLEKPLLVSYGLTSLLNTILSSNPNILAHITTSVPNVKTQNW